MTFIPITSGTLKEASDDDENKKMQLRFERSGLYEFSGVAPELWQEFSATFDQPSDKASSGRFFAKHIRSLPYKKLDETE